MISLKREIEKLEHEEKILRERKEVDRYLKDKAMTIIAENITRDGYWDKSKNPTYEDLIRRF